MTSSEGCERGSRKGKKDEVDVDAEEEGAADDDEEEEENAEEDPEVKKMREGMMRGIERAAGGNLTELS